MKKELLFSILMLISSIPGKATSGGKYNGYINFSDSKVRLKSGEIYKGIIELSDYKSDKGLKAVQFSIIIKQSLSGKALSFKELKKGSDIQESCWSLNYNCRSGSNAAKNIYSDTIMVLLYSTNLDELTNIRYRDLLNIVCEDVSSGAGGSAEIMIEKTVGAHCDGTNANIISKGSQQVIYTKKTPHVVKEIRLENYPNPFNPTTTIRYEIPDNISSETVPVVLKIYDILGREISTIDEENKEPGIYEIIFSGESFPSGTYIYSISAGEYSVTKKFVLLK
jgi:hypothetical protein